MTRLQREEMFRQIDALETILHNLPLTSWGAWLWQLRPREYRDYGPPADPTPALPGTPQKIETMAERFSERRQLFHDRDGDIPE